MPLLWLSMSFILGILAADSNLPVSRGWIWLLAGVVLLLMSFFEKRLAGRFAVYPRLRDLLHLPVLLLLAAMVLGVSRFQFSQPNPDPSQLVYYNDRGTFRLTGFISNYPDRRDDVEILHIRVESLAQTDQNSISKELDVHGLLEARIEPDIKWQYGDRVTLHGRLITPPEGGDFSYRKYLANQTIYSLIRPDQITLVERGQGNLFLGMLYSLRRRAYFVINQLLPQPEAGLLSGILLGIENDLPEQLKLAFQDTGTYHIIAISGFNIAIVAALFMSLSKRVFPYRWSIWAAIIGIAFYTLLVGGQASVLRAAVMGAAGLIGQHIGRKQTGVNSLAFTAAAMCLINPKLLWDVGFQLTFTATLGLVLFGDRMQNWLTEYCNEHFDEEKSRRISGPVSEYFLLTLAAQVMTLPVLIIHFQRISISAVLANPLILPAQPLVMTLGGAAMISGLIFYPLGQILAYMVWPLLAYTIHTVELLARLPNGVFVTGEAGFLFAFLYYGFLIGLLNIHNLPVNSIRLAKPGILLGLTLAAFAVWRAALAMPDGRMQIMLFNLGEEPNFLIQTPSGDSLLINGSFQSDSLADQLGRRMHPINHEMDVLVLTNTAGSDSLKGLTDALQRYPVGTVFTQAGLLQNTQADSLEGLFAEQNAVVRTIQAGNKLDLGDGATLEFLTTSSQGTAILLEWNRFRLLIPDGVGLASIRCTSQNRLQGLSGLILTEEDTKKSAVGDWVALNPAVLVIDQWTVDRNDPFSVLPYGDLDWIELETDGTRLWVSSSPQAH